MLGSEPILDRGNDAFGGAADVRALRIVDERVDRAEDKAAAVEMDEDGVRTGAVWNEEGRTRISPPATATVSSAIAATGSAVDSPASQLAV